MNYIHKDWTDEEIEKLCDLFDLYGEDAHIDATTLKNCKYKSSLDEKESDKDKKYKVVLAPSFPDEYRAVFEDILKELDEDDINDLDDLVSDEKEAELEKKVENR